MLDKQLELFFKIGQLLFIAIGFYLVSSGDDFQFGKIFFEQSYVGIPVSEKFTGIDFGEFKDNFVQKLRILFINILKFAYSFSGCFIVKTSRFVKIQKYIKLFH